MKLLKSANSILAFVLCSCANVPIRPEPQVESSVAKAALKLVDRKNYDISELVVGKTRFFVFLRKEKIVATDKIIDALKLFWPKLNPLVTSNVKEAAIVDFEGPFGGGPLNPFVVAVLLRKSSCRPKAYRGRCVSRRGI